MSWKITTVNSLNRMLVVKKHSDGKKAVLFLSEIAAMDESEDGGTVVYLKGGTTDIHVAHPIDDLLEFICKNVEE